VILAAATYASVRSANRSARVAERALQVGLRPVLVPSRFAAPEQKVGWIDSHWTRVGGGRAGVELGDDVIYLSSGLRNVGAGLAVLHGWRVLLDPLEAAHSHPEPGDFRRLTRDLYVPPGDVGFWQGAIRDRADPEFGPLEAAIGQRQRFVVYLLYGDHEGGQRTISLFGISPLESDGGWLCSVARHWNLDRPDPR